MERGGYQDLTGMLPRPGRALKAVLGLIIGLTVINWVLFNWVPGGQKLFFLLVCTTDGLIHDFRVWTPLTAGLLTQPKGSPSYLLFTVIGLYFLSPDLERRWGSWRFTRFLATSVIAGFLMGVAADYYAPAHLRIFHPELMFGAGSAITATAVAWSRQNRDAQVRLFFVLPVRGSWLFWFTLGYCVFGIVAWDDRMETGAVAPFGGLLTGLLLGGSPSVVRSMYLRAKLALLSKRAGAPSYPSASRPSRSSRSEGPPLRVVPGGLEDELKKRKPPKDKRFLN